VEWQGRVPQRNSASLTFAASPTASGVEGDAVRISVPVHPPLTDETVATAGQVYGDIKQYVIVPRNAVSQPGSLWVQVSASPAAGLGAAYNQFRPNDHESNEDVANRLLAASSLHSLPNSINGLSFRTSASLPQAMGAAARKLVNNQFGDGGWPWFNDAFQISDPAITADVVQALSTSEIRWPSVRRAIAQGQRFLASRLASVSPRERAHLLFVLGETGKTPRRRSEGLYNNSVKRSHLDAAGLADLGEALNLSRDPAKARTLVSVLDGRAVVSATGAHWENSAWTYFSQPIVPTTTDVLGALLRLSPRDPLIPAAARWLMLARQGSGWDCPPDTAQAIYRLAQYARAAREGQADYRYRVMIDDRSRLSGRYQGSNQRSARTTTVPVASLHRQRPSFLVINREADGGVFGLGPLYYVARLRYYLPANAIRPRNVGVGVGRQYLDLKGHVITAATTGSVVKVKLTFDVPNTLLYLHIDDPIPAGFEPIDESLNTSQQGLFGPYGIQPSGVSGQASDLSGYVSHTDIRDDHVAVYATYVPPGKYSYTYLAEASVPGDYGVAPTHASESFFPEVFGRSSGQTFTVK
jgi:alpha-2-macroglobulin